MTWEEAGSPSTDRPIGPASMVSIKQLTADVNKLPTEDFDECHWCILRDVKREAAANWQLLQSSHVYHLYGEYQL